MAKQKIADAENRLAKLQIDFTQKNKNKTEAGRAVSTLKQAAVDKVWKIKSDYTGGDRVLEYCLDGLKGQKEKLFDHLVSVPKPEKEPKRTDVELKKEVDALKGDSAQPFSRIDPLMFTKHDTESNPIFAQAIVGNEDSVVAGLIEKLGNSDWVREGLEYIPKNVDAAGLPCPFCQKNTITHSFVEDITSYFDDTYQAAINSLLLLEISYKEAISSLPSHDKFSEHPLAAEAKIELEKLHGNCISILNANLAKISQKLKNPRTEQILASSVDAIADLNEVIKKINELVDDHNLKLQNKSASLAAIRDEFWSLMRWRYDQTIERFHQDVAGTNKKIGTISNEIQNLNKSINAETEVIAAAQKETVNIDEAIENINASLRDLAIEDFVIKKHSDNLYRIVRVGDSGDAFHTLSEGERMIISFLYFCELCKGKLHAEDTSIHRIAVIDDPISSLSHVYMAPLTNRCK